MPTKLKREDDIDSAYDFSPTAQRLADSENSTSDNYTDDIQRLEDYANDPANATNDVRSREMDATDDNGGWTVNRSNTTPEPNQGENTAVKILKKGGPAGVILGFLLAFAGLVSFFGGPGLLIVQISEVITDKFNTQLSSMDARKTRIMKAKLSNTTNGFCAGSISVRCKYSSFSKNDMKAFQNAGIEVVEDKKTKITGRTKASALRFNGQEITARNFDATIRSNPEFAKAVTKAYNSKYIGLSDKVMLKSLGKSKTSKSAPFSEEDDNDSKRQNRIIETTKEGQPIEKRTKLSPTDNCDQACTDKENKKIAAENELASQAEKTAKEGIKSAEPSGFKTAVSFANSLGALDDVCMVPTLISAIGTGAKVVRAQQLIRYSMFFLTTASMIKAGDAKPNDVSYLGKTLTTVMRDHQGNLTKSATDSIGYRYAAYGDKGSTNSSTLFKVGGGLGGDLDGLASKMYGAVGGKGTCDFLGNPWVQGAGVLISFIPGGGQAVKAGSAAMKLAVRQVIKEVVKGVAVGLALNQIINYLTGIASDMVAGVVVDKNTVGEQSGDALVAGGAEMLTQTSGMGGNLPLTPDQAVAYEADQQRVLAMYDAYDQATLSPFDTSSSATFLGSIASQFVPYMSHMSTIHEAFSSLASISLSTFGSLNRATVSHAASSSDYTQCEDYEYKEIGVATTPMCNIVRGIPAKYLQIDPATLTDELINSGDIDSVTGDPTSSEYIDFVNRCLSGEPLKPESDCMLTGSDAEKKARYAVHYIDQRNIEVMENGLPVSGQQTSPTGGSFTVASYNILHAGSHPADSKNVGDCPTAGDSQECIKLRSDRQIKIIRGGAGNPAFDIVGTQETSPDQYNYIKNTMSEYSVFPENTVGMNNADHGAVAVWWNSAKFRKIDSGFAPGLSNTAKDINNPWVELQDPNGNKVYVMSIHYANSTFGGTADVIKRSSQLTMDWVKSKASAATPVVVMGDFNDQPQQKLSYCVYTQNSLMQHALDLQNAADASQSCPNPNSIHGIDHIYATTESGFTARGWTHMENTGIVRLASDHQPVYTTYTLPGGDSSNTPSGDIAWPVDKKYFDKDPADFFDSHTMISGTFTSPYARGEAADISSPPKGSPIYSMLDGKVIKTNLCGAGDGMMIESKVTSGTLQIAYGHGTNPKFQVGDTVKAGQQILSLGEVGCKVFGAHLHVDMALDRKHICPQDVFKAMSRGQTPDYQAYTSKANPGCTGR